MTRILASLLLLLLASPTFAADVFVKFKTHRDALAIAGQSQPASDAVARRSSAVMRSRTGRPAAGSAASVRTAERSGADLSCIVTNQCCDRAIETQYSNRLASLALGRMAN